MLVSFWILICWAVKNETNKQKKPQTNKRLNTLKKYKILEMCSVICAKLEKMF